MRGLRKRTLFFHIREREHPLFFPTPGGPFHVFKRMARLNPPRTPVFLPRQEVITGALNPITDGHLTHRWQLQMNQGWQPLD